MDEQRRDEDESAVNVSALQGNDDMVPAGVRGDSFPTFPAAADPRPGEPSWGVPLVVEPHDGTARSDMSDLIARLDEINQHSPVNLDVVLAQARSIGDKLGGVDSRPEYRAGVEGVEVAPDSRVWIENWVRGAKQMVAYRFAGLGEPERLQAALAWVDQKAVALDREMEDQMNAPGKAATDGVLRETLSTIPPAPSALKRPEEM